MSRRQSISSRLLKLWRARTHRHRRHPAPDTFPKTLASRHHPADTYSTLRLSSRESGIAGPSCRREAAKRTAAPLPDVAGDVRRGRPNFVIGVIRPSGSHRRKGSSFRAFARETQGDSGGVEQGAAGVVSERQSEARVLHGPEMDVPNAPP